MSAPNQTSEPQWPGFVTVLLVVLAMWYALDLSIFMAVLVGFPVGIASAMGVQYLVRRLRKSRG